MKHSAEMQRCLLELDIPAVRRLWKYIAPDMPQPTSDHDALRTLHYARTLNETIPLRLRAYSHRWLLDHALPSGLPDRLKQSAEQICPLVSEAVGHAHGSSSAIGRAVLPYISNAEHDAIMDIYSDDLHPEASFVKRRIIEVKNYTVKKLLGTIHLSLIGK